MSQEKETNQDLVTIEIHPPVVDLNYEVAKKKLDGWLKQYKDVIITEDQVTKGRKLATEINQSRLSMNNLLKEKIAKAAEPIQEAKNRVKHLDGMHEEVRQAILGQVALHDQKKLDLAKGLLTKLRAELWEQHNVEPEFHRAEFDDLIKLASVTEKENLTKAAKDALESRVRDDRSLQDTTRMRLLELENRSYRAGLRVPLTRERVSHVLWATDEKYEDELQRILDVEVGRQAESDQKYREEEERKRQEADAATEREKARQERLSKPEPVPEPPAATDCHQAQETAPEPTPARRLSEATEEPAEKPVPAQATQEDDGKEDAIVVATFKVRVDPRLPNEKIEAELRRRMAAADIKSLDTIEVRRSS